jgi:hypothetical protein
MVRLLVHQPVVGFCTDHGAMPYFDATIMPIASIPGNRTFGLLIESTVGVVGIVPNKARIGTTSRVSSVLPTLACT